MTLPKFDVKAYLQELKKALEDISSNVAIVAKTAEPTYSQCTQESWHYKRCGHIKPARYVQCRSHNATNVRCATDNYVEKTVDSKCRGCMSIEPNRYSTPL